VAFDGDSTFAFEVHVVERLVLHLPLCNGSSGLEEAIGQGAFAVVDVGNDAEISNVFHRSRLEHKISAECAVSLRLEA
jgi:tRNA U34 5-carboxymethylaminomethyl modifying enzyme MnmG/GidA